LEYFDVDIRTSSFLSRDAGGNYSFSHKSFYEYFVASRVMRNASEDELAAPKASSDRAQSGRTQQLVQLPWKDPQTPSKPQPLKRKYPTEIIRFMQDIASSSLSESTLANSSRLLNALLDIMFNNPQALGEPENSVENGSKDHTIRSPDKVFTLLEGLFKIGRAHV